MRCARCKAKTLPSVNVCEYCGRLGDAQLDHAMELRAGAVRGKRALAMASFAGAGVLFAASLPALLLLGPYGGGVLGTAGMMAAAYGATCLEEAKPYRQLRHLTSQQLAEAERAALPSVGGSSSSVAFPSHE